MDEVTNFLEELDAKESEKTVAVPSINLSNLLQVSLDNLRAQERTARGPNKYQVTANIQFIEDMQDYLFNQVRIGQEGKPSLRIDTLFATLKDDPVPQ